MAGRKLTALLACVLCLALAGAVSAAGTKHVVVVKGKGFTLTAWSQHNQLCFLLKAGKPSSSQCAQKLVGPPRVNFTEFAYTRGKTSYVGGAANKKIVTVLASFADGTTLKMKTKHSKRYRGKFQKQVRFFAGKHSGTALVRSIVGKNAHGATLVRLTR